MSSEKEMMQTGVQLNETLNLLDTYVNPIMLSDPMMRKFPSSIP